MRLKYACCLSNTIQTLILLSIRWLTLECCLFQNDKQSYDINFCIFVYMASWRLINIVIVKYGRKLDTIKYRKRHATWYCVWKSLRYDQYQKQIHTYSYIFTYNWKLYIHSRVVSNLTQNPDKKTRFFKSTNLVAVFATKSLQSPKHFLMSTRRHPITYWKSKMMYMLDKRVLKQTSFSLSSFQFLLSPIWGVHA